MLFPILWIILCFLCGSLPFSVWIGAFLLGKNIRQYGDANPGATNVLRAGGKASAALALLLDRVLGFRVERDAHGDALGRGDEGDRGHAVAEAVLDQLLRDDLCVNAREVEAETAVLGFHARRE